MQKGDIVLTTDNPYVVKSVHHGKPISYAKGKTKEQYITDSAMANMDVRSFNSVIGGITNMASNFIAMQKNFSGNSDEYKELERRINLSRRFQGDAIQTL